MDSVLAAQIYRTVKCVQFLGPNSAKFQLDRSYDLYADAVTASPFQTS